MTLDPKSIKTMENKQLKYKFTGKDLKQITESISKKMKLVEAYDENEETFDFDFEDKINVAPTKETDVEPGQELLLDEEMDYNKLKTVGKTIMKQILTLRSEILDSKYDESVVKILKNIEKLAEELLNYNYKNSTPEEKTKSVEQAFESRINEASSSEIERDKIYKNQIEKEFPGSLENYDGKSSYGDYYLELINQKKESDKISRREAKKEKTKELNKRYKEEFGDINKQIKQRTKENQYTEIMSDFVDFLPTNLPKLIENGIKRTGEGMDSMFYFYIGEYLGKFSRIYNPEEPNKPYNLLNKLINSDKYEEEFFQLIDSKYGQGVLEW